MTKILEFGEAVNWESGDVLISVDVSDASMDPTGTNKFITLGNLFGNIPADLPMGTGTPSQTLRVANNLRLGTGGNIDALIYHNRAPSPSISGTTTAVIYTSSGTSSSSGHVGIEVPSNDASDSFYVAVDEDRDGVAETLSIHVLANGFVQMPVGARVGSYTNANRPTATSIGAGGMIWNTDDGQLNISDGTNWTLPDGTTT